MHWIERRNRRNTFTINRTTEETKETHSQSIELSVKMASSCHIVCLFLTLVLHFRRMLGFVPPINGGSLSTLSRRVLVQRAVATEIMKVSKTIIKTNTDIRLEKITNENDVLNGAELCIDVFFVDEDENNTGVSSMIRRMNMKKLLRKHSYDLLHRFVRRPRDDCMVKAVHADTDEMVGYAEIFVSQLDSSTYRDYVDRSPAQHQLLDVDGYIFLPKIANLAGVTCPPSTHILHTLSIISLYTLSKYDLHSGQISTTARNREAISARVSAASEGVGI